MFANVLNLCRRLEKSYAFQVLEFFGVDPTKGLADSQVHDCSLLSLSCLIIKLMYGWGEIPRYVKLKLVLLDYYILLVFLFAGCRAC